MLFRAALFFGSGRAGGRRTVDGARSRKGSRALVDQGARELPVEAVRSQGDTPGGRIMAVLDANTDGRASAERVSHDAEPIQVAATRPDGDAVGRLLPHGVSHHRDAADGVSRDGFEHDGMTLRSGGRGLESVAADVDAAGAIQVNPGFAVAGENVAFDLARKFALGNVQAGNQIAFEAVAFNANAARCVLDLNAVEAVAAEGVLRNARLRSGG